MLKKIFLALITLFLVACQSSESAPAPTLPSAPTTIPAEKPTDIPLSTPTLAPSETALPALTATSIPTETPLPEPTLDPSIFGFVSTADAPMGFMLEPIAKVIFEAEMQKRMDVGEFGGFQVEGLSIVPRGDGTFFAEIFYALQADVSFWTEDFGTLGDDGWVHGKCARFDFEMAADGYYLKNKAVCN